MNEKYNVYLVSDSTGETLDRIFLSLKSQFANFEYTKKEFAFVRTEQQIDKIIKELENIGSVKVDTDLSIICLAGDFSQQQKGENRDNSLF